MSKRRLNLIKTTVNNRYRNKDQEFKRRQGILSENYK
jgi:hypothetical protein